MDFSIEVEFAAPVSEEDWSDMEERITQALNDAGIRCYVGRNDPGNRKE